MRRIVSDTGPLLHLWEAHLSEILKSAGQVSIPCAVDLELQRWIPEWAAERPAWLEVAPLSKAAENEAASWFGSGLLDLGEAEALALASNSATDWFLTDDSAARWVAQEKGLEVHGSLGIVIWAAATGLLQEEEAEASLERLTQTSLWISVRVVASAREALKKIYSA